MMDGAVVVRRIPTAGTAGRALALVAVWVAAALAAFALAGCGARSTRPSRPEPPRVATAGSLLMSPVPVSRRKVTERGYSLGVESRAAPGDAVLRLRNFTTRDRLVVARLAVGFDAHCRVRRALFAAAEDGPCNEPPLAELRADAGEIWPVAGVLGDADVEATYYLLSKNVTGGTLYVVADAEGRLREGKNVAWRPDRGEPAGAGGLPLEYVDMKIPLAVSGKMFEYESRREVLEGPSHENFELLFNGVGRGRQGQVVRFVYKEYSPYVTDRPIHTEEIAYPTSSGTIQFKGFRIRVHRVDAKELRFIVESDSAKSA